jgi:hypothetical protein
LITTGIVDAAIELGGNEVLGRVETPVLRKRLAVLKSSGLKRMALKWMA